MLLKKYSDFGGGKKNNLIQSPTIKFWKKISRLARQKKMNILTLVLSKKKFRNETKKP